jgi:hypothetical protein
VTVVEVGFAQWVEPANTREFPELIAEGLEALKVVAAGQ